MFGYVVANRDALTPEDLERYRGFYCGLCWALKERHSDLSRITLNYDMTFLTVMLTSMYEPDNSEGERRCMVHPAKKHTFIRNIFSDYAADMTVALAYYNCLDDWQDDKDLIRLAQSKLLKSHFEAVAPQYPRQISAIDDCMKKLGKIEQSALSDPDAAANCFGELMGELFVYYEDAQFSDKFRLFGQALGRFIYMMDAYLDYDKDKRRGSYNPLLLLDSPPNDEQMLKTLKLLIGECTVIFEMLPLVQDVDIMRNVLYSGVWVQYYIKNKKREAKDDK